jgi:hypothetical protein
MDWWLAHNVPSQPSDGGHAKSNKPAARMARNAASLARTDCLMWQVKLRHRRLAGLRAEAVLIWLSSCMSGCGNTRSRLARSMPSWRPIGPTERGRNCSNVLTDTPAPSSRKLGDVPGSSWKRLSRARPEVARASSGRSGGHRRGGCGCLNYGEHNQTRRSAARGRLGVAGDARRSHPVV